LPPRPPGRWEQRRLGDARVDALMAYLFGSGATPPRLMLGAAEAIRVIVTRIGPTERGWALASVASDLERTALMRLAWPSPT
jgi:hypothetical protein